MTWIPPPASFWLNPQLHDSATSFLGASELKGLLGQRRSPSFFTKHKFHDAEGKRDGTKKVSFVVLPRAVLTKYPRGSGPFSLVPSIDPATDVWWVLAAWPWDPGHGSSLPPFLSSSLSSSPGQGSNFRAAQAKSCLPICPSVHISIPLWLSDFGCFSHPRTDQLLKPTMLWHISTWIHTFLTLCSGTLRSLKSQRNGDIGEGTGGEGLEGARDGHMLQRSSENTWD